MATPTYREGLGRPLTYAEMDGNLEFIEESIDTVQQAVIDAEDIKQETAGVRDDAVIQTAALRDQAEGYKNQAGGFAQDASDSADQSQIFAAAAQAAAGAPALTGNGNKVLAVKSDETGVLWRDEENDYPSAGFAVSDGDGWAASKAVPSGDVVGTTATQTITNKTFGTWSKEGITTDAATTGTYTVANSSNPIIKVTATANRTISSSLSDGVARTLWVNPQSYVIDWTASHFDWMGAAVPELVANKWNLIELLGSPETGKTVALYVGAVS